MRVRCVWLHGQTLLGVECLTPGVASLSEAGAGSREEEWPAEAEYKLSHPYMTTGKTIALTRHTLVGKVMSLLFNMLSSL